MKNIGTELTRIKQRGFHGVKHGHKSPAGSESQILSDLFNELVRQLRVTFPASLRTLQNQEDMDEFRRQWLLAFAENGINTIAKINAGMRIARKQNRPFIPSPGQFIEWIREGERQMCGLPTVTELVAMVHAYCCRRGYYESSEHYPWGHPSHYWMVTGLYSAMRSNGWTDMELRRETEAELERMATRLANGEEIPKPVPVIASPQKKPLSREDGLSVIAAIRAKHGLTKRR